jgi:adenylate cyclase
MSSEIERKFLIDKKLWSNFHAPKGMKYKQGYLLTEPDKTIRIRVTEASAYLTIKGETKGISRPEFEYSIPVKDANEMLTLFAGKILEKIRYRIEFKGKIWEVDVFEGENEGLILAEIELKSENEKFEIPEWIAEEVSGDERFYNSYLSLHPFKFWE